MEDQKSTTKQIMLNSGLMLGFISILISVANFAVGDIYKPHWAVSVISIIATIAVIVLGIKKVKELNNGYLTLGEAIKTGLGIALVSGLVFLIYFFVFTNFLEPEFYARSLEVKEQAVLEMYPNLTDEQLEGAMDMQKKLNGPVFTSAILLIVSLFFGFIVALIGGLVMKKVEEED